MTGFDVDEFLDGYKPPVEEVQICQRGDLQAEHARLEAELADIGLTGRTDDDGHLERAREVAGRLQAIEGEIAAATRTFTFTAVPHEDWYRLVAEHPPTDAERAAGWKEAVSAEFWPHAVASCSTEPKLTVEQARRLAETRAGDFDRVRMAVQRINEGGVVAPKSPMATAVAQLLDGGSTSPKAKASRGRSGTAANGARSRRTTTKRAS